jgi:N-methylhydantoinase B
MADSVSNTRQRIRDLDNAAFEARYGCDRFAATVLSNRFHYVLEHVCERLLACAFSPLLRDFYDFAATVTGPPELDYPTPAVSKSFVAFTGTMTESVKNTIAEYGPENLQPGDVIIANDPYRTGTHVNDVLFCRPIFQQGKLAAFITIKAHQLDVGGSVPGGFSATKTSVYENGIVMSPRALVKAGKPVRETWTLILDNVRFGELLTRDVQTIIACLDLGENLMRQSFERYGAKAVHGAMEYVADADAERIGEALEKLPDGEWRGEALVDCDGMDDTEEYPVRVLIKKRGSRLEVDLSGTARQARTSINGTFLDTKTTVGVALKFMLDPEGAFTSGAYRNVDIVMPDGAICTALPPEGVVFAYGESTNAMLAGILEAMADALGENAIAGDYGAPNLHTGRGVFPNGQMWIAAGVASGHGPWGATKHGDADSYSTFMQANSLDTAVEVSEADYPLAMMRREYLIDTAGAGFNRGGAAVLSDSLWLEPALHNPITLRFKKATGFGVRGGGAGENGGVWLWRGEAGGKAGLIPRDGDCYRDAVRVAGVFDPETGAPKEGGEYAWFGRDPDWATPPRSTFRYLTNAGGGWGDPLTRDPERVKRDVRDGYVSVAAAQEKYGVVIQGDPEWDPENLTIDLDATEKLRAERARAAR